MARNKSHVSSKAALKNATHFKQHSEIKVGEAKGKEAIANTMTATHSASLDLETPAVKAAAGSFFAKNPSLAAEAVAQYPELAKYLAELGVTIPTGKGSTVLPTSRIVPVFDHEEQGAASAPSDDMIPDNLLRISETSLDAEGGGAFSMVSLSSHFPLGLGWQFNMSANTTLSLWLSPRECSTRSFSTAGVTWTVRSSKPWCLLRQSPLPTMPPCSSTVI